MHSISIDKSSEQEDYFKQSEKDYKEKMKLFKSDKAREVLSLVIRFLNLLLCSGCAELISDNPKSVYSVVMALLPWIWTVIITDIERFLFHSENVALLFETCRKLPVLLNPDSDAELIEAFTYLQSSQQIDVVTLMEELTELLMEKVDPNELPLVCHFFSTIARIGGKVYRTPLYFISAKVLDYHCDNYDPLLVSKLLPEIVVITKIAKEDVAKSSHAYARLYLSSLQQIHQMIENPNYHRPLHSEYSESQFYSIYNSNISEVLVETNEEISENIDQTNEQNSEKIDQTNEQISNEQISNEQISNEQISNEQISKETTEKKEISELSEKAESLIQQQLAKYEKIQKAEESFENGEMDENDEEIQTTTTEFDKEERKENEFPYIEMFQRVIAVNVPHLFEVQSADEYYSTFNDINMMPPPVPNDSMLLDYPSIRKLAEIQIRITCEPYTGWSDLLSRLHTALTDTYFFIENQVKKVGYLDIPNIFEQIFADKDVINETRSRAVSGAVSDETDQDHIEEDGDILQNPYSVFVIGAEMFIPTVDETNLVGADLFEVQ